MRFYLDTYAMIEYMNGNTAYFEVLRPFTITDIHPELGRAVLYSSEGDGRDNGRKGAYHLQ